MKVESDLPIFAKNPYREGEYFSLNVRNGVIRSPIGTRMVAIPEDLVLGLAAGLEEECGSATKVVLYACGRSWGQRCMKRLGIETRQFYQRDQAELPLHFHTQVLRRVWALYGWGLLQFDHSTSDKGLLEAIVENAMYSDVVGNVGKTTDHIIAGVLAAILSELAGRELHAVEICCKSKGDARCHFMIGTEARTKILDSWVREGRKRREILDAIARDELG